MVNKNLKIPKNSNKTMWTKPRKKYINREHQNKFACNNYHRRYLYMEKIKKEIKRN